MSFLCDDMLFYIIHCHFLNFHSAHGNIQTSQRHGATRKSLSVFLLREHSWEHPRVHFRDHSENMTERSHVLRCAIAIFYTGKYTLMKSIMNSPLRLYLKHKIFRPLVSPGMEGMLIHIPKPGKPTNDTQKFVNWHQALLIILPIGKQAWLESWLSKANKI